MKRISMLGAIVLVGVFASAPASAQSAPAPAVRAARLILRVSNLSDSTAFYRDRVGLKLLTENGEFATFDGNGVLLMLEQLPKPVGPSTGLAAFTELVLESTDVFATYAEMERRGVTFRNKPQAVTSEGTRDLYAASFRDPDAHAVSITGWVGRK